MRCEDIGKQILAAFALLDAPGIFDRGIAALRHQVGEESRPRLRKLHGGVPRSSEIQDLHPRLHPEAIAPQYHPKDIYIYFFFPPAIASSLCEQSFWGAGCQSGRFLGPKLPQRRDDPGLSLCVRTLKQGGLSEQPAGMVCSSFEQTTGSLSALSTAPGPII